jgi:WD repeat-containing protein 70
MSIFLCAEKEGYKGDIWSLNLTSILAERKKVTLGRNSTICDFGLDHASLSRVHAEISLDKESGECYIQDLGSTHGTFLNDIKLLAKKPIQIRIDSTDRITLGASTRKYYLSSAILEDKEKDEEEEVQERIEQHDEKPQNNNITEKRLQDSAELKAAIASFSAPLLNSSIKHPQIHVENFKDLDAFEGFEEDLDDEEEEKDKKFQAVTELPISFGARQSSQQQIGKKRPRSTIGIEETNTVTISSTGTKPVLDSSIDNNKIDSIITQYQLPISHVVSLRGHEKAVTCLAFDPSGARLTSGSSDFGLRFYNFAGMDSSHGAFRAIIPQEGQGVRSISYSKNGDRIVVATTSANANVFDRDAKPIVTTVKGDPYIADAANTRGHTAALSHAQFHPIYKDTLVTASLDGTVRLWDLVGGKLAFNELICGDILKFKNSKGQRSGVTSASVSPDGKSVIAGTEDGSIQLVHLRSPSIGSASSSTSGITGHKYARTDALVRDLSSQGMSGMSSVSCVVFSPDGYRFATRHSFDGRIKIWDLRKFSGEKSEPIALVSNGLEMPGETANCAWSPDGKTLIAGVAGLSPSSSTSSTLRDKNLSTTTPSVLSSSSSSSSGILFFDVALLESSSFSSSYTSQISSSISTSTSSSAYYKVNIQGGSSAIYVSWNAKINQIAAGCGDGSTQVFYNPNYSNAGALLSSIRAPKRLTIDDWASSAASEASNVLAIVPGEDRGRKVSKHQVQQMKAEHEASQIQPHKLVKSSLLDKGKQTFTEHFLAVNVKGNLRSEDPQAVLQRYASLGGGEGGGGVSSSFTSAYKNTQPVTLLASKTFEEELDEIEAAKAARRNKS